MLAGVITTIREPTGAVGEMCSRLGKHQATLHVVGDSKGPLSFDLPGATFYTLTAQGESPFEIARILSQDTYARKNLGYLFAMKAGATSLYETDDDNSPINSWAPRTMHCSAQTVRSQGWVNAYRYFSDCLIWPRGFPLDEIRLYDANRQILPPLLEKVAAPIQQGLANGSPDVDAVWRLILDTEIEFNRGPSIALPSGAWCPFNSQSTWWWPEAYALMYLPSYCAFRMTDIWRSFIAQRCLWEIGYGVVFHAAEVFQDRNPHDLMSDFSSELEGYQRNKEFVGVLERLSLQAGADATTQNLRTCYEELVRHHFFDDRELLLVDAWLNDLEAVESSSAA